MVVKKKKTLENEPHVLTIIYNNFYLNVILHKILLIPPSIKTQPPQFHLEVINKPTSTYFLKKKTQSHTFKLVIIKG